MSSEFSGRAILVAIDMSDSSLAAAHWAANEFYREGDVIHLVHVYRTLAPHIDITHSYAGSSYSVPDLKPHSMDDDAISSIKHAIKGKFTSWMDGQKVPHALHLYLDTDNAPASSICKIVFEVADEVDAAIIITACHSKGATFLQEMFMGSVAEYCYKHSVRPTTAIRRYPIRPARPVDQQQQQQPQEQPEEPLCSLSAGQHTHDE